MTTPEPKPRNYALWFIGLMLAVIFTCAVCGFLTLFTAPGQAIWRGFWQGFCNGFFC